jgi:sugar phosphate permease
MLWLLSGQETSSGRWMRLNFFLADVRDGLGPYLAIYLLTEQKWDEASIGIVMSVAALAGIIVQTGGALSTTAAGLIVVKAGYSAAFLFLAAVAGAGLIGFATMMPETLRRAQDEGGKPGD